MGSKQSRIIAAQYPSCAPVTPLILTNVLTCIETTGPSVTDHSPVINRDYRTLCHHFNVLRDLRNHLQDMQINSSSRKQLV